MATTVLLAMSIADTVRELAFVTSVGAVSSSGVLTAGEKDSAE